MITLTRQDLLDLKTCGASPYWETWEHKQKFYELKTKILKTFGMFYGYCEQCWFDMLDEPSGFDGNGEPVYDVYATHHHILEVWWLSAGKGNDYVSMEFHIPTNEFYYWINFSSIDKKSSNFDSLSKQLKYTFEGKKKKKEYNAKNVNASMEAHARLMTKFGYMLIQTIYNP